MGAGVANLVSAYLLNGYGAYGGNRDNVYCYTFAAPNTFYRTDSHYERKSCAIPGQNVAGTYADPKGVRYRCIFDIVNDDDFVPALPMEECEWTKYGRVAGISFKNMFWSNQSKFNISSTLGPNYRPQIKGNYNLYKFASEYRGDSSNPPAISEAFSSIFDNRTKMREETYNYNEKIFIAVDGKNNLDSLLFRYTLPFQKNKYEKTYTIYQNYVETTNNEVDATYSKNGGILKKTYSQEMSPQYLFASIGEMMHEYSDYENDVDKDGKRKKVNNKLKFFMMDLPPKYYNARKSFLSFAPLNLRALYLEDPHYLESYYSLTKLIALLISNRWNNIMKDKIGKVIFVLTIIFILLLFSGPYLIFELWNIQYGRTTMFELKLNDIKDNMDNAINKDKYNKILNEYIKKRFGNSLFEKAKIIENYGYRYVAKFDGIMDETFSISYDKGKDVCRDNCDTVISKDKKFQHLYSNWVKQQVGIEDESVELEFKGALRSAAWVGEKPYIEFAKITSLDNLAEQICENTHNLYLDSIDKKISNIETKGDWLQTSKMLRDEYVDKIKNFNPSLVWDNEVSVKLYYYDVDLVNDRYNHIGLKKDNTNFYYILFNLQNNDIKYLCNYYDCTGASVLQNWLKEIDN